MDLYDRPRLKLVRGMDIIFCRNCLIYFDDKAKAQIVADLREQDDRGDWPVVRLSPRRPAATARRSALRWSTAPRSRRQAL